jgi:mRNA interferase MazF
MMIFNPFDIVVVPFPFSDSPKFKRRKALVISTAEFNLRNGHSVLLMITSAPLSKWFLDVPISDLAGTGLNKPCVVRMKTFTLDHGLILEICGRLQSKDIALVQSALTKVIAHQTG